VRFLLGVVGGAAPEILRLYQARTDQNGVRYVATWFYWIVTAAFLVLAGVVAVVIAADNPAAAFVAGVQTPLVIRGIEAAAAKNQAGPGVEEVSIEPATFGARVAFRLRRHIRLLRFW